MGIPEVPILSDRLALSGFPLVAETDTHAKGNALARFSCQLPRWLFVTVGCEMVGV